MKTNIVIIGLINNFKKEVGMLLAKKLDMYYADINELIEYETSSDEQTIINKVGISYFQRLENKVVKTVSEYENTIITGEQRLIFEANNIKKLQKTSTIIYLQVYAKTYNAELAKQKKSDLNEINIAMFADRNAICEKNSDIIVSCSSLNTKKAVESCVKALKKYFKK